MAKFLRACIRRFPNDLRIKADNLTSEMLAPRCFTRGGEDNLTAGSDFAAGSCLILGFSIRGHNDPHRLRQSTIIHMIEGTGVPGKVEVRTGSAFFASAGQFFES